jgi:hypothetical protein
MNLRPSLGRAALAEVHYLPAVSSCELTVLKVVCNCEPRAFTTAMIATEMPAAINLYSMAVAPD